MVACGGGQHAQTLPIGSFVIKGMQYDYSLCFLDMYQLYVPGELESTDNVLVDIGTGYFASKVCVNERKIE